MLVRTTLAWVAFAANTAVALAAGEACKSADPTVAISACTKDIEALGADAKGPAGSAAYFNRGMAHVAQFFLDGQLINADVQACFYEDNDTTLAACSRIIDNPAADPQQRSGALFERSKLLSAKGLGAEAIADFKRTMDVLPPAISAPYDQAVADFSKAVDLDPTNAAAHAQRGDLYLARGDADKALKAFDQAITLDPKQMLALFGRALIRNEVGDPVGAVKDLKAIVALTPSSEQDKWMQDQAKQRLPTIGAD